MCNEEGFKALQPGVRFCVLACWLQYGSILIGITLIWHKPGKTGESTTIMTATPKVGFCAMLTGDQYIEASQQKDYRITQRAGKQEPGQKLCLRIKLISPRKAKQRAVIPEHQSEGQ
jgi:hypothetical protein